MRWNSFGRSLLFAAGAGLGAVPFMLFAGPFVGRAEGLGIWVVGVVALYAGGLAPRWSRGILMTVLALALGVGVAVVAGSVTQVLVGMTVVLGLCRSGFLFRARPARAVAIEVGFGVASLGAAYILYGPALVSVAFALWGYMLVQSAYFLVGGVSERPSHEPIQDPFEAAKKRAVEAMERL